MHKKLTHPYYCSLFISRLELITRGNFWPVTSTTCRLPTDTGVHENCSQIPHVHEKRSTTDTSVLVYELLSCFTNCPIPMLTLTRLTSLLMILSLASCLDADRTYYFCPGDCNFELGYGYCQVRRGEVMRFTSHLHLIRCPVTHI